jgi:putative FmdB family regulatory protein
MPVYEYKCERCSACFELKQAYDEKPRATCHICGGDSRRVFRPVPIVFKGSGFYITDHATNKESVTGSKSNNHNESAEPVSKVTEAKSGTEKADKKEIKKDKKAREEKGGIVKA